MGHAPFRSSLQEAPKPAPAIPCYNTQVNAIKQLLYYQETSSYVGVHYYMMRELKPCVTFDGSHTEKNSHQDQAKTVKNS